MTTTIHDVARSAGVSVTTVSRALGRPGLLRPATRERVLAAAKALDYHPNRAARSLITGKTGNIGIVVPDIANPFYPGILRGVQLRAHEAGYAVLLADSEEDPAAEENLVRTMAKQVDGVIICAPFATATQLARLARDLSLVLINRRIAGVPAVLMDTARGMHQVVSHLRAIGHHRLAYLGGPRSAWSNRERLHGLHTAMRKSRQELTELGPFEPKFDGGYQAVDLALDARVTAIIAYNDLMALGALRRLAERGIRVPDEMSVVGFDDLLFASMCAPALTTVSMPMEASGRAAVDLLLAQPASGEPRGVSAANVELATHLIVRATTAQPPAQRSPSAKPTARALARRASA